MNKKLLLFTVIYILIIYLTLPLGRYIVNFLYANFGKENLSILINILLVVLLGILFYLFRDRLRKLLIILPFIVIVAVIFISLDRPEERAHFIQYEILGIMAFKLFGVYSFKGLIMSVFFVFIVGAVDELIQWFLPNRVGDVKDVLLNLIGGTLGICIGKLYWSS
ncbi:VanZ family protein [Persephonella sp.]